MNISESKYHNSITSIRSVNQIREGMLSHPDNADRQEELELLIDWRLAQESHNNRHAKQMLAAFNEKMGAEKSPGLRALTLLHELNGDGDTTFRQTTGVDLFMEAVYGQPSEKLIVVDTQRLESVRLCPVTKVLPVQNIIDFGDHSILSASFAAPASAESKKSAEEFVEDHFVYGRPKAPTFSFPN